MAHIATQFPDFTDDIQNNGSFVKSCTRALVKVFRKLSGKVIYPGQAVVVNNSTVQVNTGPSFLVRANKMYRISGTLLTTVASATGGIQVGLSLAGSSTATGVINYNYSAVAGTNGGCQQVTSNPLNSASTGLAQLVTEVDIEGYFIPDVSGLLNVTFAQIVQNASNVTVNVGSSVRVLRLKG